MIDKTKRLERIIRTASEITNHVVKTAEPKDSYTDLKAEINKHYSAISRYAARSGLTEHPTFLKYSDYTSEASVSLFKKIFGSGEKQIAHTNSPCMVNQTHPTNETLNDSVTNADIPSKSLVQARNRAGLELYEARKSPKDFTFSNELEAEREKSLDLLLRYPKLAAKLKMQRDAASIIEENMHYLHKNWSNMANEEIFGLMASSDCEFATMPKIDSPDLEAAKTHQKITQAVYQDLLGEE